MYVGSTMCFAGGALWQQSPTGLLITLYVWVGYVIALRFEGYAIPSCPRVFLRVRRPFTNMIYAKRAEEKSRKAT